MRLRRSLLVAASLLVLAPPTAATHAAAQAKALQPPVIYRFSDDGGGARSFVAALQSTLDALPTDVAEPRFAALFPAKTFATPEERAATFRDFVRLRALFEATRDAGFFGVRWAITNEEPASTKLWKGLEKSAPTTGLRSLVAPSVTGECDEISALFAFLATQVGVKEVGLFWPTTNHTIAAWTPSKKSARILIPTTQIFQSCEAGFGTTTFSSTVQKTVYAYQARDLAKAAKVTDAPFFLAQLQVYAPASDELLALLRLDRGQRYDTSFGACTSARQSLVASLSSKPLSAADQSALRHYLTEERRLPASTAANVALLAP